MKSTRILDFKEIVPSVYKIRFIWLLFYEDEHFVPNRLTLGCLFITKESCVDMSRQMFTRYRRKHDVPVLIYQHSMVYLRFWILYINRKMSFSINLRRLSIFDLNGVPFIICISLRTDKKELPSFSVLGLIFHTLRIDPLTSLLKLIPLLHLRSGSTKKRYISTSRCPITFDENFSYYIRL